MVKKYNDFILKSQRNRRINDIPFIAEFVEFSLNYMFAKKSPLYDFDLEIYLVDSINNNDNDLVDFNGLCQDWDISNNRKLFNIKVLQTLSMGDIIDTLAHELGHLYQTAMGHLIVEEDGWIWKKQFMGIDPYKTEEDYFNLPWEADADNLQRKMCKKFFAERYKNW